MTDPPDPGKPLSGRVAVVTGASRRAGIGFAVARRLGMLGADLYLRGWLCTDDAGWVVGQVIDSEGGFRL